MTLSFDIDAMRERFFGWQCRVRQIAMRESEGRPSPAMRPSLYSSDGALLSDGIITLIVRGAPEESTEYFKFQLQKYHDPKEVRDKALQYLQATHYHGSERFSDQLTALFGETSELADKLVEDKKCVLTFSEFSQGYRLECDVELLEIGDRFHAATLWHNRIFNPHTSDSVKVLSFKPDWTKSEEVKP